MLSLYHLIRRKQIGVKQRLFILRHYCAAEPKYNPGHVADRSCVGFKAYRTLTFRRGSSGGSRPDACYHGEYKGGQCND